MCKIRGSMVDRHILRRSSLGSLRNSVNVLRVFMSMAEGQVVFKRMKTSSDVLVVECNLKHLAAFLQVYVQGYNWPCVAIKLCLPTHPSIVLSFSGMV